MSTIPEKIIDCEELAKSWKLPQRGGQIGYWNQHKESKCKNLIIGFVCKLIISSRFKIVLTIEH